jgi:hypothetical protein
VFRAEGYDPNGSYVGVTALQVALEHDPPNHEMVLILLKFGADPDKNTASRARGPPQTTHPKPEPKPPRGSTTAHMILRALRAHIIARRAEHARVHTRVRE